MYKGLDHGFGIGTGTVAEGWILDAMKKLLAEKKVEVTEKKPPEVGAPSKRPSMGVDD